MLRGALIASAVLLCGSTVVARESVGEYTYRGSASGLSLTTAGLASWTPRSVEAVVHPLAGAAGSAGVVLHYADAANHYLFLVSTNSAALMIYKSVGGTYTLLGSEPFPVPFGEDHVLRGEDAGGGTLNLYWDGVLELTVTDTTFTSGRVGLRVWNMTVDFDDVLVKDSGGATLLFDDFEDGNAEGWNPGAGWSVVRHGGPAMPVPAIATGFEGGNGELTLVDPATWTVNVRPELKGSSPYRAWFYFKLSNVSSAQPTNVVFENASFFTRPYYSYDDESWLPFPSGVGNTFTTTFTSDPVWIAHSIPYLPRHEEELIADLQAAAGPAVRVSTLATSEGGLPVKRLRITAPGTGRAKRGVWIVARHHAWEASGSWIADGLARWLVSGDPQAVNLLLKADLHVVPIMDVDNVVLGGSGKDQSPVDFNRDWRSTPHWNAVGAAIDAIDSFAASRPYDLFIDSHCPGSSSTFLAVQPSTMVSADYWQTFLEFRQLLISTAGSAALPYTGSYTEWGPTYHPLWNQMSFWHQYDNHPELRLSLTLETQTSSLQGYRELSAGLGRAIEHFLPEGPAIPRRRFAPPEPLR